MLRVDVHQHLLSESLVTALAQRDEAPRVARGARGWTLRLVGEPDSLLPYADADAHLRLDELHRDGLDRVLISLSSALGIESSRRAGRAAVRAPRSGRTTAAWAAGTGCRRGAADIHRVLHAGEQPAVTIHAYSPPLERMGAYVIEPDGALQRHAITHEQELRPLRAEVTAGAA